MGLARIFFELLCFQCGELREGHSTRYIQFHLSSRNNAQPLFNFANRALSCNLKIWREILKHSGSLEILSTIMSKIWKSSIPKYSKCKFANWNELQNWDIWPVSLDLPVKQISRPWLKVMVNAMQSLVFAVFVSRDFEGRALVFVVFDTALAAPIEKLSCCQRLRGPGFPVYILEVNNCTAPEKMLWRKRCTSFSFLSSLLACRNKEEQRMTNHPTVPWLVIGCKFRGQQCSNKMQ